MYLTRSNIKVPFHRDMCHDYTEDAVDTRVCWLISVWSSKGKHCSYLLSSVLCLGNQPHLQKEPGLPPADLLYGHPSPGPPANTHTHTHRKQLVSSPKIIYASESYNTHTLDIKIPSCDALPPRMLKPSCAPGGFFNTMVRGRNWVSSLL